MTDPRVVVLEQAVAFDGFFKVIRYRLRHRQFAGGMGGELGREVLERGHAVAVLPFDPMRDQVVLIEQFRIGALGVVADPWLVEPVAGIIEPGEPAPEVARREALEEAGLELMDLVPACSYFASPEANVGGFGVGSDLTWNVQAFVGYRTTVFGQDTTFALGYRALYQDYHHKDFEWDVTMHGPVLGTALHF
jgi:8-oxo-dGTP pyrophosphatase MutT (NUDIX family)